MAGGNISVRGLATRSTFVSWGLGSTGFSQAVAGTLNMFGTLVTTFFEGVGGAAVIQGGVAINIDIGF